jgi:hypothetical protein
MRTSEIDLLKAELLTNRTKIRAIIESAETPSQLDSCERMIDNWHSNIQKRLDSFKPMFFFKNTSCWRSAFELYLRVKKANQCLVADRKSKLEPGVHYYKCSVTLEEALV